MVHAEPAAVQAALGRLSDLALAWESQGGLRPLTGVADLLVGGPDLGVSGVRPRGTPPVRDVEAALAALSPAARGLLEHVEAAGGEGRSDTARPGVHPDDASTPVEELLARRLLLSRGGGTAVVPGEVAIALRGGHTTRERVDVPPEVLSSPREQALVDRSAGGAAFEIVRRVELLLDHWGTSPPGALRSGGLAVRDLKSVAALLHVDEPTAALVVETAYAAGLLAQGVGTDGEQRWLPTEAFDAWSQRSTAERWVELATAWLGTGRMPALVGTRDAAGKAANALSPEISSAFQAESRRMALDVLAALPPGESLATGTGLPSLVARVRWQRPRRPRSRDDQVVWAITESEVLGVAALGALPAHVRALLAGDSAACTDALAALLPAPVTELLIQADLTAIAPGPLESALARTVHLLADVESRGGATVYRFTPASIRRAFDVGWSAADVHEFVESVARTAVPQPLSYLIDDVARTFGTIRVGQAESFLRADDEAALTELMAHPQAARWGLRRLAPTVIVSSTPLDVLLPRLRELGLAPVVEAADGSVRVARPDLHRVRGPRTRRASGQDAARETSQIGAAVAAIRAGDRVTESRPSQATDTSPIEALALLREAAEVRRSVLIGYVDNHGTTSHRIVDPLRVEGGQLTAFDHRAEDTRSFAVHRITSVSAVTEP